MSKLTAKEKREVFSQFDIKDEETIQPKLIGHLNKKYGYQFHEPINEGTPIYELPDGRTFFEIKNSVNGSVSRVTFCKGDLNKDINFIICQ